MKKVKDD